ncbi:MAG: arginine--tRNA ligase [Phycisphaera sp.]|nr:arginine--tRNA ligase [Phycisphaera sp.]
MKPTPQTIADPLGRLEAAATLAVANVGGEAATGLNAALKPSAKPEFGDFQLNAAMALGKKLGRQPREIAAELAAALLAPEIGVADLVEEPEIAGPGFINLRLRPEALATALRGMDDETLGVIPESKPHGVTIDVCGVNVAKQMHVGHLRSTVIGDTVARLFERVGRKVHRQNHLGDWGLPIAMTLHSLMSRKVDLDRLDLDALNVAYRDAQLEARGDRLGLAAVDDNHCGPHRRFELECQEESAAGAQASARDALVRLQSGDPEMVAAWKRLIEVTMEEVYKATSLLNTRITPASERGESSFRDELSEVVDAFVRDGLAVEDDGALVVRFADRERPMLIRKRDGGFLYATTDLAALRYRVQSLDSDEVVYVVDARQRDHFRDVFDACRMIGWAKLPDGVDSSLKHLGFGTVLGPDKKPLKTRSGANFKLMDLLAAAIDRGRSAVRKRASEPHAPTHGLPAEEVDAIGRAVGIAAIKYADLSTDTGRDYVFDLDRMVTFEGDTGPYLQYAHARLSSMLEKAGDLFDPEAPLLVVEPEERRLTLMLLRYGDSVAEAARSLEPARLCRYLFSLATEFSTFYSACPVLKNEDPAVRASRLRLVSIVQRVLADGLDCLGIEAPRRM